MKGTDRAEPAAKIPKSGLRLALARLAAWIAKGHGGKSPCRD